jgi:hypothetical protein
MSQTNRRVVPLVYCTVTLAQSEIAHDLDPLQLNRDHALVGLAFLGSHLQFMPSAILLDGDTTGPADSGFHTRQRRPGQ